MKLLIGIPSYLGTIPTELFYFLNNMKLPEGCEKDIIMTKRTFIAGARNLMAKKAVMEDYDYLLFIDDDNIPENYDALLKLIDDDKPIVCGYYKDRHGKELVLYNKEVYDKYKFTYKNIKNIDVDKGNVQQIGAAGAGFMLINVKVLTALYHKYSGEIFEFKKMEFYKGEEYNFEKPLLDLKHHFSFFMGEDICFCHRAAEHGFHTYVDIDVPVLHIAQQEIIAPGLDKFSVGDKVDVSIISEYNIESQLIRYADTNYEFIQQKPGKLNDSIKKSRGKYIIYMGNILLSKGIDQKLIDGLEEAKVTGSGIMNGKDLFTEPMEVKKNSIVEACWAIRKSDLINIKTKTPTNIYKKFKGKCGIVDGYVHLLKQK